MYCCFFSYFYILEDSTEFSFFFFVSLLQDEPIRPACVLQKDYIKFRFFISTLTSRLEGVVVSITKHKQNLLYFFFSLVFYKLLWTRLLKKNEWNINVKVKTKNLRILYVSMIDNIELSLILKAISYYLHILYIFRCVVAIATRHSILIHQKYIFLMMWCREYHHIMAMSYFVYDDASYFRSNKPSEYWESKKKIVSIGGS